MKSQPKQLLLYRLPHFLHFGFAGAMQAEILNIGYQVSAHICYFLSEVRDKDFHVNVLNYKILARVFKQHQQLLKTQEEPNQMCSLTLQPTDGQFITCVP